MELLVIQAANVLLHHLESMGVVTHQHTDFTKFKKAIKKVSGRGPSGQFSFKSHNLRPENAFWLEWCHEGRTIAVHAFRYEELRETSLADLWMMEQERIYGGKLGTDHPPIVEQIRGKVVYNGDFRLLPEYRGEQLPTIMALLSFFLIESRWKPDWIYGFMDRDLVLGKGFNSRVGYSFSEPRGTHWVEGPPDIDPDDWLVCLDRKSLVYRISLTVALGLDVWLKRR